MKFTPVNILYLILLMVCEWRFILNYYGNHATSDPVMVSAIGMIMALIGIFGAEPFNKWRSAESKKSNVEEDANKKHDSQLLDRFLKCLPEEPTISFLKNHNFANPYYAESVEPLKEFVKTGHCHECQFKNKKIEKKKNKLIKIASKLYEDISFKSFPDRNNKKCLSFSRLSEADVETIDSKTTDFAIKYSKFVSYARGKLDF